MFRCSVTWVEPFFQSLKDLRGYNLPSAPTQALTQTYSPIHSPCVNPFQMADDLKVALD